MAAPSDDDDALLITNEEVELSSDTEVTGDDDLSSKYPEHKTDRYHSSTGILSRFQKFGGLDVWAKLLLKWWRTLVIVLTPIILLLLLAIAEDTKVRISHKTSLANYDIVYIVSTRRHLIIRKLAGFNEYRRYFEFLNLQGRHNG